MPKALTHPRVWVQPLLGMVVLFSPFSLRAEDLWSGPACATADMGLSGLTRILPSPAEIVWVGEPPTGLTHEDVEQAIRLSTASWNDVRCSTARLDYVGRAPLADVGSEQIVMRFADAGEDPCLPEGYLGFTVGCAGNLTVLLASPDFRWSTTPLPFDVGTPPIVDLQAVITHELGHVLGLGHDDSDARNTMSTRYLRDGGQATLTALDKLLLCEGYPNEQDECTIDTQCPAGHPCVAQSPFRVCDDERGEIGDYCGIELQVCPQLCHISSPSTSTGYCTEGCQGNEQCPTDMQCLENTCVFRARPQEVGCSAAGGAWPLANLIILFGYRKRKFRTRRA